MSIKIKNRGTFSCTGDVDKDAVVLKKYIDKQPGTIGLHVYPEIAILVNRDKNIAALAEVNFEMANPFDVHRVFSYWNKLFTSIGYKMGQLHPDEIQKTPDGKKKRKVIFNNQTIKFNQPRKKTFDDWLLDFELILSELDIPDQIKLLELCMTPDANYSVEEMKFIVENIPISAYRMMNIDSERTMAIISQRHLACHGMNVDVDVSYVDPEDPQKGYISHIKKKEK